MAGVRVRTRTGAIDVPCGLCGHEGLVLERSRNARRGLARVNPRFPIDERSYRSCPQCGARDLVIGAR
jgi:DNA-directed RNA polymerase subunit RPC12/RpoP